MSHVVAGNRDAMNLTWFLGPEIYSLRMLLETEKYRASCSGWDQRFNLSQVIARRRDVNLSSSY